MNTLARYHAANLPDLMDKITKNSIGMDDYLNSYFNFDTTQNYPPYNLININNVESLHEQKDIGVSGVIIGKAIYEKKIDLKSLAKFSGN